MNTQAALSDAELHAAWAHLYRMRRDTHGFEADMRDDIRARLVRAFALAQRRGPRARLLRKPPPRTPARCVFTAVDIKRAAAGDRED